MTAPQPINWADIIPAPVNDGSADVSASYAALQAAFANSTRSRIIFPKGQYRFDSKPAAWNIAPQIDGDGIENVSLLKNYSTQDYDGLLHFAPGCYGWRVSGLLIMALLGTQGGSLIGATGAGGGNALGSNVGVLEDLYLTSQGLNLHSYGINIDGSAKNVGAIGIRVPCLRNIHIFGARWAAARFSGVEGLNWDGGGIYPGATGSGALVISGSPEVPSQNVRVAISTIGKLVLSRCSGSRFDFASIAGENGSAIENDGTVFKVTITAASISGTVTRNWNASTLLVSGAMA